MKKPSLFFLLALFGLALGNCTGESHEPHGDHSHDHDHDHPHHHDHDHAGPNGGHLLKEMKPQLEFWLRRDGKVQISAVEKGRVIAITDQVVTVSAGEESKPVQLTFARDGNVLVSEQVLPKGDHLPVVVRVEGKGEPVTERFTLHLKK